MQRNYFRSNNMKNKTMKDDNVFIRIENKYDNNDLILDQDRRYSYNKEDNQYHYGNDNTMIKSSNFMKNQRPSYKQHKTYTPYQQTFNSLISSPSCTHYSQNNYLNDRYTNKSQYLQKMMCKTPNERMKATNENSFQKYLQLAKKEKLRNIQIPQTHKKSYVKKLTSMDCYAKQNFVIEELRQTEDTVFEMETIPTSHLKLKINDFKKLSLLGKGKNGEVYLVIHKKTGFACAMKIIKKKQINRGNPVEKEMIHNQLLRQIKIQMSLSHPNIIDLYGVFADQQNIYLLQQLGLNGPLYDLMKKKNKFSEQTTALISREVLKGLQGLHQKNIIHRDIKPQNIVLVYGISKICDFGWSVYCPADLRKTLCGTPLYLSPEILIGDQYNEKIDIWAFGTLVYQLFTGQNPFKIRTKSDLKRIVTDQVCFSENFPRRLKSFLQFILKKNSCQRPTSKQIEQHDFLKKYVQLETSEEISNV